MTLAKANPGGLHVLMRKFKRYICEALALRRADVVFVALPGSGQTWLRVMLSRFYQIRYGLTATTRFDVDKYHLLNPEIPRIFFTHDGGVWCRPYQLRADKSNYAGKKVVLLVRHPIEVAVSQYVCWRRRNTDSRRKGLGHMTLEAFVWTPCGGLPTIVAFLNDWYYARDSLSQLLIVRYEDVCANPGAALQRLAHFLATDSSPDVIAAAVRVVDCKDAYRCEPQRVFDTAYLGARTTGGTDSDDVCKGEIGAYRTLLPHHAVVRLEAFIRAQLPSIYGYVPAIEPASEAVRSTKRN